MARQGWSPGRDFDGKAGGGVLVEILVTMQGGVLVVVRQGEESW